MIKTTPSSEYHKCVCDAHTSANRECHSPFQFSVKCYLVAEQIFGIVFGENRLLSVNDCRLNWDKNTFEWAREERTTENCWFFHSGKRLMWTWNGEISVRTINSYTDSHWHWFSLDVFEKRTREHFFRLYYSNFSHWTEIEPYEMRMRNDIERCWIKKFQGVLRFGFKSGESVCVYSIHCCFLFICACSRIYLRLMGMDRMERRTRKSK